MPTEFNKRLRTLVDTVHPPHRGPFTQVEIVEGIKEQGGSISQQYLSELLRGVRGEPSDRIVRHLADFFGVPVAYFHDSQAYEQTNAYVEVVRRLATSEFLGVSARGLDLPPEAIERIREAVENERRAAGLD